MKEPIHYTEGLSDIFHRGRLVEQIIANGEGKQFARVLLSARKAGSSSGAMSNFVRQLQNARHIALNEKGWISTRELFQSQARDSELFTLICQANSAVVAVDELGTLYLSEACAIDILYSDRHSLHTQINEYRAFIFILLATLGALVARNLF